MQEADVKLDGEAVKIARPISALELLLKLKRKCPNPCPEVLEDGAPCTNCYAQKSVYRV